MKSIRYNLLIALLALLTVGCDVRKEDEDIIANFDPAKPAFTMLQHSLKTITTSSGALIGAFHFDLYLSAPDEQTRLEIEDRYYPYLKVRSDEDDRWLIYNEKSREEYQLQGGLLLHEVGSLWRLLSHPKLFKINSSDPVSTPQMECTAPDCFSVKFGGTKMTAVGGVNSYNLRDYLRAWNTNYYDVKGDAELTIKSNLSAFRAGEAEALHFTIEGEGTLCDIGSSGYEERFTITEPLEFYFGDDGLMCEDTIACGQLTITNSYTDRVVATLTAYNTIFVEFFPKDGGRYVGYYDWLGNSITPR